MRTLTAALFSLSLCASACSKGDNQAGNATPAPPAPAPSPAQSVALAPTPSATAKPAPKVELAIESVANTMAFDKTKLSVPAGAEVHLTIKNNATMSTLPHNWVLVKTGTEASVAAAGLKYGEPAGYIDIRNTDMLEHTPLAKPGESAEVTFTAPDPGTYPYICTVPGHYVMMKGVLTVTP
jgi:azurin